MGRRSGRSTPRGLAPAASAGPLAEPPALVGRADPARRTPEGALPHRAEEHQPAALRPFHRSLIGRVDHPNAVEISDVATARFRFVAAGAGSLQPPCSRRRSCRSQPWSTAGSKIPLRRSSTAWSGSTSTRRLLILRIDPCRGHHLPVLLPILFRVMLEVSGSPIHVCGGPPDLAWCQALSDARTMRALPRTGVIRLSCPSAHWTR
jgi:hypothetical protein